MSRSKSPDLEVTALALQALAAVEAMQGGTNGPTIRIRDSLRKLNDLVNALSVRAEKAEAALRAELELEQALAVEPVAWMFIVRDPQTKQRDEFAAIDWVPTADDPREMVSKSPLYAAPRSAKDALLAKHGGRDEPLTTKDALAIDSMRQYLRMPSNEKKAAIRYLHLRDPSRVEGDGDGSLIVGYVGGEDVLWGDRLDAAIDADILAQKDSNER